MKLPAHPEPVEEPALSLSKGWAGAPQSRFDKLTVSGTARSFESVPTGSQILETLRTVFGHTSFRPLQREIVTALLEGKDAFVLMPTGGGKSLCFQLPALLLDGLTVVVSPLIALMKDQVDALQALGVAATFINSSLAPAEAARRQGAVARGALKLLYVAPERLMMPPFLHLLSSVKLALVAIDEAHCISEWGHDFRPEYRELEQLRLLFPSTPRAAFTATATRRVQADIVEQLDLQQAATFRGSFNRPNLAYEIRPKRDAYRQLTDYLRPQRAASGIVYCLSRSGTERLAARLQADGFNATAYHAGLESEDRRQRQEAFTRDDVRIIVATIAFGMGIDKPDVRFVVHYDLPKNLEGYYQESGRAGRDGDPSDCILFYSYGDDIKLERFIEEKPSPAERQVGFQQLRQMVDWAQGTTCRRRALLAYFDEPFDGQPGPCCDVCREPLDRVDCTIPAQMLLSCARRTGEQFGVVHLIRVLRGSQDERILRAGHDRLSTYGIGRDRPRPEWHRLAEALLLAGYARLAPDEFNAMKVTERGEAVLFRGEKVLLALPRQAAPPPAAPVVPSQEALFDQLRALRKRLADERGVAPFVVFHDSTLRLMAAELPTSREQIRRLQGVGDRKLEDFGDAFLSVIADRVRAQQQRPHDSPPPASPLTTLPRRPLGPTIHETLRLFQEGLSVPDIARARELTSSTIENHLALALEAGETVELERLLSPEKRRAIEAAIAALGPPPLALAAVRERLGDTYTYGEIRLVLAALGWVAASARPPS